MGNPFSTRTVAGIVIAGVLAFLGFLLLTAYAPQLKLRSGEGATPMSKSAVGFHGLYALAEASGRPVDRQADRDDWYRTGFTIVVIPIDVDVPTLKELVAARRSVDDSRTLYILPKWITFPMPTRPRWVQSIGTLPPEWSKPAIEVFGRIKFAEEKKDATGRVRGAEDEGIDIDVPLPRQAHYLAQGMTPVLVDDADHVIMGRTDFENGAADYILADPDLLSNMALKTPEGARAALTIVDALRADSSDSVAFDLSLNGLGNKRNLLQLMFEPPFLALTLAVLAAALLAGLHAFNRFGPAVPEPRAIPFGKRALADNAAVLIASAGAARRMGDRYVAIVREAAAGALGAGHLTPDDQEGWLARLKVPGSDFATLAASARGAQSSEQVRAAAAALHEWRNEVTRDR